MDLRTEYMGLRLKNPLVASSSPLCEQIDRIKEMEDSGASAIVLHSLFEEQITLEENQLNTNLMQGADSFAEALSYFPELNNFQTGPEAYVNHIRNAKAAVDIPIIGSLNGLSTGGWIRYAKAIQEAGADGLELNIYFLSTSPTVMGSQVEQMYISLVKDILDQVSIPVAVKLNPFFSSLPNIMKRLDQNGVRALVLFNRFYQPDIDIYNDKFVPVLKLSTSDEIQLRLRWISIMHGQVDADMALTGGVHTAEDVLKAMMAGAKTAMMTSAVLKNGINHFQHVLESLSQILEKKKIESIQEIQGIMSHRSIPEKAAFVRANYMKTIQSYH